MCIRDRRWWGLLPLLLAAVVARGTPWFVPAYFATVAYGTFCVTCRARLPSTGRNDFSYGLYLYGWPMQQLALLAGAATPVANTIAATALAGACAALSWFLVEKPALGLKRRLRPTPSPP